MMISEQIRQLGVVPVAVIRDAKDAVPLAKALCEGGLPCAEVTFRTEAAEAAIAAMTRSFPDMLVGAGTVLTIEQADRALAAGAKFIVSPGFDAGLVDYCLSGDIPVFPGVITPSEVMQAVSRGLKVVKYFPAEAFGGIEAIKAISAPFPGLSFMPTGGIGPGNLEKYLSCPMVLACGGSWMVKAELVSGGRFDEIRKMTEEAVELIRQIRKEDIHE